MKKEGLTPKSFNTLLYTSIAVVILIIVGAISFFILRLDSLSKEVARNKYLAMNNNLKIQTLSELEQTYNDSRQEKEKIYDYLPLTKDVSALLSDLESMASQHNLNFVTYQIIKDKKATLSKDKIQDLQIQKVEDYYLMAFMVQLEGSYTEVNNFIGEIENYDRLIEVTAVKYTKQTQLSGDTISAEINISAYLKP